MSEKDVKLEETENANSTTTTISATVESKEKPVKKGKKPKEPTVSTLQLFRFATRKERVMLLLALFFSAASGALQPVAIITYGTYISSLTGNLSMKDTLLQQTLPVIHIMAYMGTASLIAAYFANCLWVLTGDSQTRRIRSLYLHAILRQDMSWFDKHEDGSLNTRLASDTQIIQDGISEKFGLMVTLIAQFLGGLIVAFVKGNKKLDSFCKNDSHLYLLS